jgi:flagellar motor switch protein FliG
MPTMDDKGLEDAAILLMSLGEEEAAEVFKHLAPKEVQRLGETIAKLKSIPRDRVEQVIDKFDQAAARTACWSPTPTSTSRAVLRKALGDDKANLLIDRILQGSDTTGIESLKWMDPARWPSCCATNTRRSWRRSWCTSNSTRRPPC